MNDDLHLTGVLRWFAVLDGGDTEQCHCAYCEAHPIISIAIPGLVVTFKNKICLWSSAIVNAP